MKILIVKNKNVSQNYIDKEKKKLVDYFNKKAPKAFDIPKLPISFDEVDIDIPITLKYFGTNTKGVPWLATENAKDRVRAITKEGMYHAVYFVYDPTDSPLYPYIKDGRIKGYVSPVTFHKGLYDATEYVEIPIKHEPYTWQHELVHVIGNIYDKLQLGLVDEMDKSFVDGEWIPYFNNSRPTKVPSNYSITLTRFAPYFDRLDNLLSKVPTILDKENVPLDPVSPYHGLPGTFEEGLYKPKHFKLEELVPKDVLARYGEQCWQFFDRRVLMNLDYIRNTLGMAINVNGSRYNYRGYDDGSYRKGESQHKHGRAIDFDIVGMPAETFRSWIKDHYQNLPEPNVWIEDKVTWNHMDVRYSDKEGLYLFNA